MRNQSKVLCVALLVAIVSVSSLALPAFSATQNSNDQTLKNVIMMIPDGCSQSAETAARWYKGSSLNVDA